MSFYALGPEVAGGLGSRAVVDASLHPPSVQHLHYEVEDWLGDDLLESTPCFLISPAAAAALERASCTGLRTTEAEITVAPGADLRVDRRVLDFLWLRPQGEPGEDDLGLDDVATLVVSDRALGVLRGFDLHHCDVTAWS